MDTQLPSMSVEVLQLWQLQHRLPIARAKQNDQVHLAEQLHPPRLNAKQGVFTRTIFVISVVVSMYIYILSRTPKVPPTDVYIYIYYCDFQQLSIMLCDAWNLATLGMSSITWPLNDPYWRTSFKSLQQVELEK